MAASARIPPNFNFHDFDTEDEALKFLRKFAFARIQARSDYSIWETKTKPKVRANMYLDKRGVWVVARPDERLIETHSLLAGSTPAPSPALKASLAAIK